MKRRFLFTICVVLALAVTLYGTWPVSAQQGQGSAAPEQLLNSDGRSDRQPGFQGSPVKNVTTLANAQTQPSPAVFVSELYSGSIIKVDESGTKTVFASGLTRPTALKLDRNGNLFVIDEPGLLKITPTGSISTFTTDLPDNVVDLTITEDGKLFALAFGNDPLPVPSLPTPIPNQVISSIWELVEGGAPSFLAATMFEAPLGQSARSFTTGPGGDFYLAMQGGNGGGRILRVTRTGEVSTFFDPGLPPFNSGGGNMADVRFNSQGEMLILGHIPPGNTRIIWKVQNGVLSTFVTPGETPQDALQLTIDAADNLFVSGGGFAGCVQIECLEGYVKRVDPFGNVTTLATFPRGVGQPFNPIMDIDDNSFDSFLPADNAGGPYEVNEGASVTLTASGGDLVDEPLTFAWDLDDDGIFETPGQSATFSAADLDGPSTHTIAVQVTDSGGLTATDQTTVDVLDVAPTADFISTPSTVPQGQSATLSFSNPFDPSAEDAAAGFHYSYDCTDDGTFELADASDASYSCAYPFSGTFAARGRIADKDGGFTDYTTEVVVTPAYTVIDLGTLGGSFSHPAAINEAGQIIGWANLTGNAGSHAFVWDDGVMIDLNLGGMDSHPVAINEAGQVIGSSYLADNTAQHAFLWENGVTTDLGTLGGDYSYPTAINEAGQVVGYSYLAGNTSVHAFLWENGVMTDLGGLGGSYSYARAINEAGQVIGYSYLAGDTAQHAFVWENGVMTDLGTLGGRFSYTMAINEAGQVIGSSHLAGDTAQHAFIWENGVMTDLGALRVDSSIPQPINGAGQVIGSSSTAGSDTHAFMWDEGAMTDLGALGGSFSYPLAINEVGQVIGHSTLADNATQHAFLWENGVMTDLGTLGGRESEVVALNEAGQVTGFSYLAGDASAHAFVWEDGVMTSLGTLGGIGSIPVAINEAGQVLGYSYLEGDTSYHAFVAIPANQPPPDNAGGPYRVNEGDSVTITASGGDLVNEPLTFAWDLDNNGSFETPGQSATFSAAALDGPSAYTIKVQVTDNGGLTATYQTTVHVLDVAPTADFTSTPGTVVQGHSAILSFSNPFDPSADDAAAGYRYSYDCTDDGTFELANALDESLTCSYLAAGTFIARGRIHDDGGFTDYTVEVVVTPVYTMTDLGALGGSSRALAINEAGQVIGYSYLPANTELHAFLWDDGVMADLGTLGGVYSYPIAINEAGQVIGHSYPAGSTELHAFIWENGVMTDLGTLGGNNSYARAINEAGQLVGQSTLADGSYHAFLWENGVMTDLGTLGGTYSNALTINEAGEVIGESTLADGSRHAFLWENGVMTDLGTLGGSNSHPVAINEAGQVIGNSHLANGNVHAFLWENEVMTDLGTLGGSSSYLMAINGAGQVIGYSHLAEDTSYHAFLWENGVMTDLGTLGGGWSEPVAINEAGQVIGHSNLTGDTSDHAFLWENGVMTDLGTLGGRYSNALAINEAGQVTGTPAFLWEDGVMIDLGTLGGRWSEPAAINQAGEVIGYSYLAGDTSEHAFVARFISGITPLGENVTVSPGSDTTLTFANISSEGQTTVRTSSSAPPLPAEFSLGDPPIFYELNTTAAYSPPVTVCITYDPAQYGDPSNLRLLHYANNEWVDVTTSNDTTNHMICGQVSSLSPFVVAETVNQPPTTSAGGPYDVNEAASVVVTASGNDPENESLTYAWDLDNDGSFETTGQSVTFSAASLDGPSAYTIQVQVTDNSGLTATDQATVNVLNVAPAADLTIAPDTLMQGESATLAFSNPFDPSATDVTAGFQYSYDCTNDGTFELASASDPFYTCAYPATGTFAARGRIEDKDGGFTDYTVEVIASPAYTLTDLTLGGSESYPVAINEAGQVIGYSYLADETSYHAFLWDDGVMTDLGTLGGNNSRPIAINEAGQVIGFSNLANGSTHAFLWENGVMTDLGTFGGFTYPVAINEAGQVTGYSYPAGSGMGHAFLWENGVMTDLGTLGGNYSIPVAINEAGQVIGRSNLAGTGIDHAFLWENGVMTDLGTLGGSHSHPDAINEAGQVIGTSLTAGNTGRHTFLWENGVMTDLGTLGGSDSFAVAINDAGQVIGDSYLAGPVTLLHAFLWENGVMTDLGTLGGSWSYPVAINEAGQVIGSATPAGNYNYHAFFWENGVMTDLGTLGGSETRPVAINEAGQVIGFSYLAGNTARHAFVWEDGVMTDLGTLGGSDSRPVAINQAGQVIGYSSLVDDTSYQAFVARLISGITPSGSDVTVSPGNGTTLTFADVSSEGQTTVTTNSSAPDLPAGFSLGNPPTFFYEINTTATYSPPVTVCITYDPGQYGDPSNLRLLHYENNEWVDATSSNDTTNHVICGEVSSLSPFAVAERVYNFSGFFQPVDNPPMLNVVKAGSAVPVKFSLGGDWGLSIFEAGYPSSQGIVCERAAPPDNIETVVAGSSGLQYDATTDTYTYVWKTQKGWAGTCRQFILRLNDGTEPHVANFKFTK